MITALVFTWFTTQTLLVVNALRRPVPPGRRFPPLWLPAMVISEFAPWVVLINPVLIAALALSDGIGSGMAQLTVACFLFCEVGLVVLMGRSLSAAREAGATPSVIDLWTTESALPEGVVVSKGVRYWQDLEMMVMSRPAADAAPALIYLHPGSWMRGRPGRQARPLLHSLARRGWVILDITYPLSPAATFPDHLIGVKRAIHWAKTEGGSLGIDPKRVTIAGGSSGAHLAALAALTADMVELQPGFEDSDTSLVASAPHYGIYDLLVRNATRYDWPFVARHVMKARPTDAPELYRIGSPIDMANPGAPPFLVIHGEFDSVVLPAESVHFVHALREAGVAAIYHEVSGGQHGFDAFSTLRSRAVGEMVADFLEAAVTRAEPGPPLEGEQGSSGQTT